MVSCFRQIHPGFPGNIGFTENMKRWFHGRFDDTLGTKWARIFVIKMDETMASIAEHVRSKRISHRTTRAS